MIDRNCDLQLVRTALRRSRVVALPARAATWQNDVGPGKFVAAFGNCLPGLISASARSRHRSCSSATWNSHTLLGITNRDLELHPKVGASGGLG